MGIIARSRGSARELLDGITSYSSGIGVGIEICMPIGSARSAIPTFNLNYDDEVGTMVNASVLASLLGLDACTISASITFPPRLNDA